MFIASEDICFILIENILLIDKSTEREREREENQNKLYQRGEVTRLEVCGLRFSIGFPDIKRII